MKQIDTANRQLTDIVAYLEQSHKENRRWIIFWLVIATIWLIVCLSWLLMQFSAG